MDFAWSEQQRELLSAVDRFASEQLNYDVIANDRDARFQSRSLEEMRRLRHPGFARRRQSTAGSRRIRSPPWRRSSGSATRCKDNGLLFSINAHMWTAIIPLLYNGTEAQKKNFCPDFATARSSAATR